jgi:hypothetical protein
LESQDEPDSSAVFSTDSSSCCVSADAFARGGGDFLERIKPKQRPKILYLGSLLDEVCMNDKHAESADLSQEQVPNLPYVRRTISISPKINKWIQDFRAKSMQVDPTTEYDYTTVANYLMAWGIVFTQKYQSDYKDGVEVSDLVGDRLVLLRRRLI